MSEPTSFPSDIVPEPVWADTPTDREYVEREHDTARYDRDDQRADAIADQGDF